MLLGQSKEDVTFTLKRDEALALFELLQRLIEDDEKSLLPLLHSSAEFAVLCRINNHLEKILTEAGSQQYEALLTKARARIIRETGRYAGIEEK